MIVVVGTCFDVFFFKQKTAYEMRISDWSSDVCSSDLIDEFEMVLRKGPVRAPEERKQRRLALNGCLYLGHHRPFRACRNGFERQAQRLDAIQIGRASCRERVCQYV